MRRGRYAEAPESTWPSFKLHRICNVQMVYCKEQNLIRFLQMAVFGRTIALTAS
jgi:hypothetical protein